MSRAFNDFVGTNIDSQFDVHYHTEPEEGYINDAPSGQRDRAYGYGRNDLTSITNQINAGVVKQACWVLGYNKSIKNTTDNLGKTTEEKENSFNISFYNGQGEIDKMSFVSFKKKVGKANQHFKTVK